MPITRRAARPPKRRPVEYQPASGPEAAALGCILQAGGQGSQATVDQYLEQLSLPMFSDEKAALVYRAMVAIRAAGAAVDMVTTTLWLRDHVGWAAAPLLTEYEAASPSQWNFSTYVEDLQAAALKRWSAAKALELQELASSGQVSLVQLRERLGEMFETTLRVERRQEQTGLQALTPGEHLARVVRADLCLVGDNDFSVGYEGVAVIAGPPGSGKSLVAMSLALAGARGNGLWMGRPVHRAWRTLVIQAENGAVRLRHELGEMRRLHPDLDLDRSIRVSLPPEGGLPFHRAEFRRRVAMLVREFRPDMVVLDPWTQVAVDDTAKDIVDKLAEIRSALPPGDDCPALVIVAHTKKPRPEDGQTRGRSLMYTVSGSQALVSTARSVWVLLPYTDDVTDDRVLWCNAKMSNGQPPADTVWKRRIGTFFAPDGSDPREYWERGRTRTVQDEIVDALPDLFDGREAMTREELRDKLIETGLVKYSTAARHTDLAKGFLVADGHLVVTPMGLLARR